NVQRRYIRLHIGLQYIHLRGHMLRVRFLATQQQLTGIQQHQSQTMQFGTIEVPDVACHDTHASLRPGGLRGPGCGNHMPILGVAALQAFLACADLTAIGTGEILLQGLPLGVYIDRIHRPQTRDGTDPFVAYDAAPGRLKTALLRQMQESLAQHIGYQHTGIQHNDLWNAGFQYFCSSIKTLRVSKGRPNSSLSLARKDWRKAGSMRGSS